MKVSDMIILIISICIVQIIFIYNYASMTSQAPKINIKNLLIIIISSIILFINNYYNLLALRFFVGIMINSLTSLLVYKNKFNLTLFYSIMHAIIGVIMELIFSPILMFKFDNVDIFNNSIYFKCIFSIIVAILTIFIFKNNVIKNYINKVKYIIFEKINIYIAIIITLLFLNFLGVSRAIKTSDIDLIVVTLVCSIFMIITIRIIINDKYNLTTLNEKNKNIRDSFEAYAKTIEDCRELKHNLKNDLYTVKTDIPIEHHEKINSIILKYNQNYDWITMIGEIPEGLQGLIYLKQKEASKKKIKLIVNTKKIFKTNNNDYIDLCSILGILIDNAIEATSKTKEKIIEIILKEDNKTLEIKIINTFLNNIDLNKIGNKNYSTKEYKSGLGLNFVKKINNPKIKVNFKIVNNLFMTNILYRKR